MIKGDFINIINDIISNRGWILERKIEDRFPGYMENEEAGCMCFLTKMARVKEDGPFEWPNMVAQNQAVASFIKDEKRIVNIGSGTGIFELFASEKPNIQLVATELDEDCIRWCKENQQRDNIIYCSDTFEELINKYGKFDLAVTVDVIEHVKNYRDFLKDFSKLADRSIITTPNKSRDYESLIASPPSFPHHIREWTAGEFYWILRIFYNKVQLYSMPNQYEPKVVPIGLLSTMSPLIALCEEPYKQV